jgi:hydrogenase maturation protein HypF
MARSYCRDVFGAQIPALECFRAVPERQLALLDKMIAQQIQTVETSSCGRLFDAVAALIGLATEVTFEGQAAIALETAALAGIDDRYPFEIQAGEPSTLDMRPTLIDVVADLARGRPAGEISARFHNTLSAAIAELCSRIEVSDSLNQVCLSGGTFQNVYLLERTAIELERRGLDVFLHATVPANDGGIALGQAVIANEVLRKGD